MKKLILFFSCFLTMALYAEEPAVADAVEDNYTAATLMPIYETQDENVMVRTRCLIYVNSEYLVPSKTELRGFYRGDMFVFRVGLDYYGVKNYYVWDLKSRLPFVTLDDQIKNNSVGEEKRRERRKKNQEEDYVYQ